MITDGEKAIVRAIKVLTVVVCKGFLASMRITIACATGSDKATARQIYARDSKELLGFAIKEHKKL